MRIVENIKVLCAEREISIPKLEKILGLSNGSIYNWNKSFPSIDKVIKVADYFNVSLDFISGRVSRYESYTGNDGKLAARGANLSESQINKLLEASKILSDIGKKALEDSID